MDSKLGKYRSEVAHLDQKLALPQQVGINVVLRHSPERREVLQHSHSRARPVPPARRDLSPPSLFAIPPYASRSFSPAPRTSPGRGRSPAGSGYAMHSPGYALAHARPQGGFVAAALTQVRPCCRASQPCQATSLAPRRGCACARRESANHSCVSRPAVHAASAETDHAPLTIACWQPILNPKHFFAYGGCQVHNWPCRRVDWLRRHNGEEHKQYSCKHNRPGIGSGQDSPG